jgi:sugar lactone lactonase YvrE
MDGLTRVELVFDGKAELAEGPCWLADRERLLWVDIMAGQVHLLEPATGDDRALAVGQPVGAAVPADDRRLALAVRDGFAMLDPETGTVEHLVDVESDRTGNRMNDGKCDYSGRFWAGTMALDDEPGTAALYRLEAGRVERMVEGVTTSNGLDWSPDGRLLYYIDTPTRRVDVFDFDAAAGTLANRRPLATIPPPGLPDGMTVDAEGDLWVALWGGWRVLHLRPDGSPAGSIELPVSRVTSCCFGGPELRDLYITTAWQHMDGRERAAEPLAGCIFHCRPGTAGLPTRSYRTG